MNERIRVLAEQADAHACIAIGNQWLVWEELTPGWAACRDEKFAELIVRECISMCDNVSADYLKHRKGAFDFQDKNIYAEGEAACDVLKYKMKKHFGVEE
jgi:hypothetical protein